METGTGAGTITKMVTETRLNDLRGLWQTMYLILTTFWIKVWISFVECVTVCIFIR